MAKISEEDADGFINLNVRVHRADILNAIAEDEYSMADTMSDSRQRKLIGKKLFREIAQLMADHEPFSGGDDWEEAVRNAHERATEDE